MSEIPTTEVDSTKEFDLVWASSNTDYHNIKIEWWQKNTCSNILGQPYSDHFPKKALDIDAKLKDG